jgi:small subunit ribosomal protein S11
MSEEENKEEEKKQEKPAENEKTVETEKVAETEKVDETEKVAKTEKVAETEKVDETEKKPESEKPSAADENESSKEAESKNASEDKSGKTEETAADLLGANIEQVKIRKAKGSKNIASGICFIVATFNNTKVSFSDMKGNVISWSSSGKCNFRGSRKSTAYAAQVVTQDAGKAAMSHGMREVLVKVKGPGMGRDSAIRALQSLGFSVTSIIDVTPVPHNGCRPPKRRRV